MTGEVNTESVQYLSGRTQLSKKAVYHNINKFQPANMATKNNAFVMQIAARFFINSTKILMAVMADDVEEERSNQTPAKYCLDVSSPTVKNILSGDEAACQLHLRMTVKSFRNIVIYLPIKRHGWSREIDAIVFLFWLAVGCSYRSVSISLNISVSTVFNIVTRTLKWLLEIGPTMITFPTEKELQSISAGFADSGRSRVFRHAAGSIDETYVNVLCPPQMQLQYVIQLQLLCDHNGKIINMCTGCPGSVYYQRVFRTSPLYFQALYPPERYFILGDSGYTATTTPITVLTPFQGANLPKTQQIFNKHHNLARSSVQRCIDSLKKRWIYLFADRSIELKLEKAVQVITVCCALHNVCVTSGDILQDEARPEQGLENDNNGDDIPAKQLRDRLCAELLTELHQQGSLCLKTSKQSN